MPDTVELLKGVLDAASESYLAGLRAGKESMRRELRAKVLSVLQGDGNSYEKAERVFALLKDEL